MYLLPRKFRRLQVLIVCCQHNIPLLLFLILYVNIFNVTVCRQYYYVQRCDDSDNENNNNNRRLRFANQTRSLARAHHRLSSFHSIRNVHPTLIAVVVTTRNDRWCTSSIIMLLYVTSQFLYYSVSPPRYDSR